MFLPEIFNIGNVFKQYFEIVPAYSSKLKDEVYRLRHQVYCEDLKYEPIQADRREVDEHDSDSLHLLMRGIKTNEFVGCTRIVRPRRENPQHLLPFEVVCSRMLDRSIMDPIQLQRDSIAEVSRLAVISSYRRRKDEANQAISISNDDFGTPKQPRFPFIPVGLYLGTIELARINGITTLFVLAEQRQVTHFSKLGVKLHVVGKPVEHRGPRVPAVMNVNDIIVNMRTFFRTLYQTIAADIKRNSSQ
ncbi:MAG: PEP-CTERM/exosortase system-associated acyltransferase [Nitrosospira sp.]